MNTMLDRGDFVFKPPELGCVLSLSELPGGSGKVYDRSPYGNIGSIIGATWVRLPSGLWCLDFDGTDDYVDLGSSASLYHSELSAGIWIYTEGVQPNGSASPFFATAQAWMFLGDGTGNNMTARLSTTPSGALYPTPTWPTLPFNQWNHILFTWKRPTLNYYLNAVLTATGTRDEPIGTTPATVKLGQQVNNATCFKGKEALPKIYNRALSALEIQNHFDREKHLFGRWSFTVA